MLALGLLAGVPTAVADVGSSEIVRLLNAQREANGIPGDVTERGDWSAACAKHNYYEAQTGEFGHSEDPGSPYYSAEGDWAARNSVIASGTSWTDGNPWEDAPIHLLQMLAPELSEMGAAESYGHNCATTWPGYNRPSPTTFTAYSYPGDGVSGVVPTEYASESPFIPGDFIGLPEGTATGRYLLVYLRGVFDFGGAEEVTATATLSNAQGPVELRVIDSTSPDIGAYMPRPSAFLIPAQPLKPLTTYKTDVTWSLAGATLSEQAFTFTTGTDPELSGTPLAKKANPCGRHSRAAQTLRRRAKRLHARGAALLRSADGKATLRRGSRMLARSTRLKKKAQRRQRQAKRCRAHLPSS